MPYFSEFLTVAVVHLLAVSTPGPDFILISRNSLVYSRKVGIFSALGLGLGILVHVTYSLVGIGLVISQSIILFSLLKYLGAAYLIYIGYKCLKAQPQALETAGIDKKNDIGVAAAIKMGFLTNVLNPKASLFFFALFTQVISPATPKLIQVGYGLEMAIMTFAWFAFVAVLLSHKIIKTKFASVQHYVERAFGVILIGLGIKVALSTR